MTTPTDDPDYREMLLLGAGASAEAGVPTASLMTPMIFRAIESSSWGNLSEALAFVVGGLAFDQGIEGRYPLEALDVEAVFEAVRAIARRRELQISPFVGSWHQRIQSLEQADVADPFATRDVARAIQDMVSDYQPDYKPRFSASERDLERALKRLASRPNEIDVFERLAEEMIRTLIRLAWIDDRRRIRYLEPILRLARLQSTLTVATLNYDNAIELLAESAGVACDTGVGAWTTSRPLRFRNEGIALLKLHGSIDWRLKSHGVGPMRSIGLQQVADPIDEPLYTPAVVFGQAGKLQIEGPFVELLQRFAQELRQTSLLTVVGYSFRDGHVNHFIRDWLNQRVTNRLRVIDQIDPFNSPAHPTGFRADLWQLLRSEPGRVEVIVANAGSGLHELWP